MLDLKVRLTITAIPLFAGRVNQLILLDDSFACRASGPAILRRDKKGLYFACKHGRHYIEDQRISPGKAYAGLYRRNYN